MQKERERSIKSWTTDRLIAPFCLFLCAFNNNSGVYRQRMAKVFNQMGELNERKTLSLATHYTR